MNQIDFKKYTFWPDIKKMNEMMSNGQSNHEFLAFGFEISMTQENKTSNAYFTGYLFLDFYEGQKNVNFEIPNSEDDSDNFFLYRFKNEKITKKKTVHFENGKEKVIMKSEPIKTVFTNNLSYRELVESLIDIDILSHFNLVKKFLTNNDISYDTKNVNTYIQEFIKEAENFFMGKLNISVESKFDEVKSLIVHHQLSNSLTPKSIKQNHKI